MPDIAVFDPDLLPEHSCVTFSIAAGNADGLFGIDALEGHVFTNKRLDRESQGEHRLRIVASDNTFAPDVELLIQLIDVNDHQPTLAQNPDAPCLSGDPLRGDDVLYEVTVSEVHRPGSLVPAGISACDPDLRDSDPAGTPLFGEVAIGQPLGGDFHLDNRTGALTLVGVLDRERKGATGIFAGHSYPDPSVNPSFVVRVEDTEWNPEFARLRITVADVNDNAPSFASSIPRCPADVAASVAPTGQECFVLFVQENRPAGLAVATLAASDPDCDIREAGIPVDYATDPRCRDALVSPNSAITYAVTGDSFASGGFFVIDVDNGTLFTTAAFDREARLRVNLVGFLFTSCCC